MKDDTFEVLQGKLLMHKSSLEKAIATEDISLAIKIINEALDVSIEYLKYTLGVATRQKVVIEEQQKIIRGYRAMSLN